MWHLLQWYGILHCSLGKYLHTSLAVETFTQHTQTES